MPEEEKAYQAKKIIHKLVVILGTADNIALFKFGHKQIILFSVVPGF